MTRLLTIASLIGALLSLVGIARWVMRLVSRYRISVRRLGVYVCLLSGMASVAHATIVFDDDFEYVASRAASDAQIPFEAAGWTDAKANNTDYAGSGGYLYTQDNATVGSKVLVMESLPTTVGGQTSYHLSYGSDAESLGFIPGNIWFQFWTYAVPGSLWDRQKFLYPCHTSYPCPVDSYLWLISFNTSDLTGVGDNVVTSPAGGRFFRISSSTANYSGGETWNADKLFQNVSHTPMLEGTWYQVKIHMDTSGAQGTYEAWIRERGATNWTKIAEWIGGVTANFDWPIPVGLRAGNKVIAMPTTVDTLDSTTYMDDLVMATTEADLPVYTPTTPSQYGPVLFIEVLLGIWSAVRWLWAIPSWPGWGALYARTKQRYWQWAYCRAVGRWQRAAPLMIAATEAVPYEHHGARDYAKSRV